MNNTASQTTEPGGSPLDGGVRPGAEARWYCLSRDGMATLCKDEEDAKEVAAESWVMYPQNGPYRAAQMVDAGAVAVERERCAKHLRDLAAGNQRAADMTDNGTVAQQHAAMAAALLAAIEGPNGLLGAGNDERCRYPECNCPFDAPADPNWCAKGLPNLRAPNVRCSAGQTAGTGA